MLAFPADQNRGRWQPQGKRAVKIVYLEVIKLVSSFEDSEGGNVMYAASGVSTQPVTFLEQTCAQLGASQDKVQFQLFSGQ